jgi:hypothetical protein
MESGWLLLFDLTKHGLCCQILLPMPNTKFNGNHSGRGRCIASGRSETTMLIVAFRCRFEHAHTIQHFDHTAYLGLSVNVIVSKPRFSDSQ